MASTSVVELKGWRRSLRVFSSDTVWGLRRTSSAQTSARSGGGEAEGFVGHLPILRRPLSGARVDHSNQALRLERERRGLDLVRLILHNRLAVRGLVATVREGVEGERVGVRRRELLLQQDAEDARPMVVRSWGLRASTMAARVPQGRNQ